MSRKIFISYRFSDREIAHTVTNFFQPQGGNCDGKPAFVTNDVSSDGEKAIDEEIKRVMTGCIAVLFVVGDNNHNSTWIDREVELAVSYGLSPAAVQLPGTTGGPPNRLKEAFKEKPVRVVDWTKEALCEVLNAIPAPTKSS